MNSIRPSIGQFSGYFNLHDKDYSRLENSCSSRLNTASKIPLLSKREFALAYKVVRSCLLDWNEIADKELVPFLWPDRCFAFDEVFPLDRTLNVWFATCKYIELPLIERFREQISHQLPLWRIVLRLPRGDNADITIYPDTYIVGDTAMPLDRRFEDVSKQWYRAEEVDLLEKSNQVRSLRGCLPISTLDEKLNVFQLAFFRAPFGIVEDPRLGATLWLGTSSSKRGTVPNRFRYLRIGESEYRPSIFSLSGTLGSNGNWDFQRLDDACGEVMPFPIPTSAAGLEFTLAGSENKTYKKWEVSGIIGSK